MLGQIICIANAKGGVGKTTSAVNLSTALGLSENRTLLLDCDPQGHASLHMGITGASTGGTLKDILDGGRSFFQSLSGTILPMLQVLPACSHAAAGDQTMLNQPRRWMLLRELLQEAKKAFAYLIMDTPPSLTPLTLAALAAADTLLIPIQCDFYALNSLFFFCQAVNAFTAAHNPDLKTAGVFLTMVSEKNSPSHRIAEEVRRRLGDLVFQTAVPRSAALQESVREAKPLLLRQLNDAAAQSYLFLAEEVMQRCSADHRPMRPAASFG